MAQLGLDAIATKILAAYNTQVERNKEVVESNGRAFEQAMETIRAVYLTHSQAPGQQLPGASAEGQLQQPVGLPTFAGASQAPDQTEGALAASSAAVAATTAAASSAAAPTTTATTTSAASLLQHEGSLQLPLALPAVGSSRNEAVALPSFSTALSPDKSASTALALAAAPATPTARPASAPETGGAGGGSLGTALSVLTPPDLISGLALQGDGEGTLLPPRVRRKRRGTGLGPSGFRRLGGFSEEVERALSSFRQYLTRFHVSSFTGQKLSETTVHYRVAAVRRLLAAAGKNEVSPHVLEDLRRACADDRNALNAISDLETFLLHHHRPGASSDADHKLAPSTTATLKPPATGEAAAASSTGNGQPTSATTEGSSSLSGSLGEDLAIALMPSPSMLLPVTVEGVVAPPPQQPRMRMPAAGKDLVRWMSHEKGGKVSISTAYSYGRYLMYDLLPKAGFKAEEDGGKQQGGAGLKAFVLKHRQALEAMLPPCRLPYPRERAAWKLLYEYASGEKIWEEEGDFWTNRGKRKQQLLQHKAAAAQHKQQQLLLLQQQALRGSGGVWSTPLAVKSGAGGSIKHSLLREPGPAREAGLPEDDDEETDEEAGGMAREGSSNKRARHQALFDDQEYEEEDDGYDYDEEEEGEYDEEDVDEEGVGRSYGLNGGQGLGGEEGDDEDEDEGMEVEEGDEEGEPMDDEEEEGRAAASLASWAQGGSALLRRVAEAAEAAQATTTNTAAAGDKSPTMTAVAVEAAAKQSSLEGGEESAAAGPAVSTQSQ